MSKENLFLLFFIFSLSLLVLSLISICLAPIINNLIKGASKWGALNCELYKHYHDYYKNDKTYTFINEEEKEKYLNNMKKGQKYCNFKKGMYSLEYLSFFINILFYFILSFISLMALLEVKKIFSEKIRGLIGIISGIVGFILTLLYLIFSQYVFINGGPGKEYENLGDPASFSIYNSDKIYKLDKERALAEWNDTSSNYECFYYKETDEDSLFVKYKDLGKAQYNYNKEFYKRSLIYNSRISACNCIRNNTIPEYECKYHEINNKWTRPFYSEMELCPKLHYNIDIINIETRNKYIYDRWIATIFFSYAIAILNICVMAIGCIIFQKFKEIKNPNISNGQKIICFNS
jgi:hypothetical protein